MSEQRSSAAPLFTQVDVSPAGNTPQLVSSGDQQVEILRDVLAAQDRTNELMEELVNTMAASQRQRSNELNQWKSANPRLAKQCREAAEVLSQVQVEYLERMTEEISDSAEDLVDGEFVMNEFVDRFGPRLAHLNGVIQVLAQLSAMSNPTGGQS